jgi:hypothetical protein
LDQYYIIFNSEEFPDSKLLQTRFKIQTTNGNKKTRKKEKKKAKQKK